MYVYISATRQRVHFIQVLQELTDRQNIEGNFEISFSHLSFVFVSTDVHSRIQIEMEIFLQLDDDLLLLARRRLFSAENIVYT